FLAFTEEGVQPVTLQQTAVYRRGDTRWLLAPPLEEFWGEWQTKRIDNFTYAYPLRDEKILSQLTNDLHDLLDEICPALPEVNCKPEKTVHIRFSSDPESLLEAADPASLYQSNLRLEWPTPTLVGLPIDDEGYQALLFAYEAKLVAALISDSLAYECCEHAPVFQAIMNYQLSELGLAEWPVDQKVQQEVANTGAQAQMLFQFWNSTEFSMLNSEDSYMLFSFVDFLLKQQVATETPVWLLDKVNESASYQSWLGNLAAGAPSSIDLIISRDWWFFTLTQSEVLTNATQPISLPAQDLLVGCVDDDLYDGNGQTRLMRYLTNSEGWQEEYAYTGLAFFNPLPNDDGVVLQLIDVTEEQNWQTMLVRDGRSLDVMNLQDVYSISLGQMDPNGRFLLSYFGTEDESLPRPLLIDTESCQESGCSSEHLSQTPFWSPDGRQMLLTDMSLFDSGQYTVDGRIIWLNSESFNQVSPIWLREAAAAADEAVKIDDGASPFWITNELFGYIRPVPASNVPSFQEVVIVSTADRDPKVVVETVAIGEALPDSARGNTLIFRYAIAHPTNPDLLLLMASTQTDNSYLFQVNWVTQEVELLFPMDLSRGEHSLGFSPDGRFLVATGTVQQETQFSRQGTLFGALLVYDFETGELKSHLTNTDIFFPAFSFDWSLDGNWLAYARDNNVIGLLAPAYDYQRMISHNNGNCTSLSWINPLPSD
ncbi:MAG: PD40 domain-containing protein, partial [Anaerolineales bacterium]|nr:PD40 domain-containing protein [Anaerolineales bacterium]